MLKTVIKHDFFVATPPLRLKKIVFNLTMLVTSVSTQDGRKQYFSTKHYFKLNLEMRK